MSEDAPVNTGAVAWPGADSAYFAVRSMQIKLHRWAGEDSSRRFGDLFNLVYDPAFLVHAWERVSSNKGARTPGIDKATVAAIETWVGVEEFLGQIRDSLKSGEFSPVEVRQVMIPKKSGKLRKLGIPTVADRVVQASLKAVLEPIFEADFKPCSYGFRPNRRAHDAIAEIHHYGTSGYRWVLECDIKACFDEISHPALMDRLRVRIKDKRVGALVKAFLRSGVLTDLGDREETLPGTPQGGILTPPTQWATSASKSRWVTGGWSGRGGPGAAEMAGGTVCSWPVVLVPAARARCGGLRRQLGEDGNEQGTGRDRVGLRPPGGRGPLCGLRHLGTPAAGPPAAGRPGRSAAS
jgi:retron-type reverse transcriptase